MLIFKNSPKPRKIGIMHNPQLDPYMGSEWEQLRKNGNRLYNYLINKDEEQAMDKVVIELEEKYREVVDYVKCNKQLTKGYDEDRSLELDSIEVSVTGIAPCINNLKSLANRWFGFVSENNVIKVIERIHSADEIKFVEAEKYWHTKGDAKNWKHYFGVDRSFEPRPLWVITFNKGNANEFTESEFKQTLINTNCPIPFDKWEGVEV